MQYTAFSRATGFPYPGRSLLLTSRSLPFLPLFLVLVSLVTTAAPTAAHGDRLPELGDPSAAFLSPQEEQRLGQAFLRKLRSQANLLDDPVIQDYMEHLTYRLASHSDLRHPDMAMAVVNNREINAFAVPGGVIGINAGLFLHAHNEDEVAAVLAHEIGHISQNHFARRYADTRRMSRAVLAGMMASLAVAIAGQPQLGMAGLAGTQAAGIQSQLAYSRHHEREADRVGMQILVRADMDPHAMPRFFERLQRAHRFAGQPPEFMLTHPVTEERIADSRARAERLGPPRISESLEFSLVQARVRAGFIREPGDAATHFRRQYEGGDSVAQQGAGYGLAVALIRKGDYDEAREILKTLLETSPDEFRYRLALAELEESRGDHEAAISQLRDLYEIMPGNYATSMMLARNLLAADEHRDARRLLERLTRERPSEPEPWRMLAESWAGEDDMARAQHARGEYLFASGLEGQARQQLRFALEGSRERLALHSKIRSRLQEMERLAEDDFFR